ncbi:hypothetical protein [Actinomadura sp. 9N215]|uniref:hypothetical protein n=1 Tax=Actinomadura sp. 9N215 TaxID=3375150 RepID=UPI0037B2260F
MITAVVLAVAGAVAANQILNDGVWRWWPWAPVAVGAALVSVVVEDRLTRLPPADLPATSDSDSGQGGRQAGDALALPGLGQPPGGLNSCEAAQPSSAWPVRFGAVPPLASCFQDRDLAGSLARHLEQGDTVVLTGIDLSGTQVLAGLGGVGKTQLAADHAHRLWTHRRLDLLAWITAGSRRDIQVAYAGVAARVLSPDMDDIDSGPQGTPLPGCWIGWP